MWEQLTRPIIGELAAVMLPESKFRLIRRLSLVSSKILLWLASCFEGWVFLCTRVFHSVCTVLLPVHHEPPRLSEMTYEVSPSKVRIFFV